MVILSLKHASITKELILYSLKTQREMLQQHPPSFNGFVYEYLRNITENLTEITGKVRPVKVLVENNFPINFILFLRYGLLFQGKSVIFGGKRIGNLFYINTGLLNFEHYAMSVNFEIWRGKKQKTFSCVFD